jgi:hypothetical protein
VIAIDLCREEAPWPSPPSRPAPLSVLASRAKIRYGHKKLPVPATLNLAEEIKRKRAAEALLAADDSDPDVDPDIAAADKEAADAEAAAQKEVDDQLAES